MAAEHANNGEDREERAHQTHELLDAVETLLDHPEETSPLDDGWLRAAYDHVRSTVRTEVENAADAAMAERSDAISLDQVEQELGQ